MLSAAVPFHVHTIKEASHISLNLAHSVHICEGTATPLATTANTLRPHTKENQPLTLGSPANLPNIYAVSSTERFITVQFLNATVA